MEANQMQPGARHQCGQALQELQWRHDDVGGAVAVGAFELQHDLAGAVALEPLVGNGGAGNVAAQAFELLALVGATAYCRVYAKGVRVGAQYVRRLRGPAGQRLSAQHLVPCAWPECDAVGAGGRLQGRERAVCSDLTQVARPLFFDQIALARQPLHDARDDLLE